MLPQWSFSRSFSPSDRTALLVLVSLLAAPFLMALMATVQSQVVGILAYFGIYNPPRWLIGILLATNSTGVVISLGCSLRWRDPPALGCGGDPGRGDRRRLRSLEVDSRGGRRSPPASPRRKTGTQPMKATGGLQRPVMVCHGAFRPGR